MSVHTSPRSDMAPGLPYDRRRLEDIGYMTCMTLTLLGNYAQTGHFGGPLAYTPFNVAAPGRPRAGWPPLRLPETQAPVRRQVHTGRWPLCADLLRAVDDPGPGPVSQASGHWRSPLPRRSRRRMLRG